MGTGDRIAIIGLLVAILGIIPGYLVLFRDGAPSPTPGSTVDPTTVTSATDPTAGDQPGGGATTRPSSAPTRPPTTQPRGGVTFRTSIDLGEGLDIDRRRRSNGLAAGVDLVNSGGSIDYTGAEDLAYAPIAVSGSPTRQECAAHYQQSSNTWPTIRFDIWGEGQDFCVVTDAGALAAFRVEKLPTGPTTSVVGLAVVVWG